MSDYSNWKILKTELNEHLEKYTEAAAWCNENGYYIADDGTYYKVLPVPPAPETTLEERVQTLEREYNMVRWQREGILAENSPYSDYAKAKATEIEDLAEELRKQEEQQNG